MTTVSSALSFMGSLFCLYLSVDCRNLFALLERSEEEAFQPLCSRMCSEISEDVPSKATPRYQCSCSRSCAVYGDCCYDSPYKTKRSMLEVEFVCLPVVGRGRYRAVSSCLPNQHSDSCKNGLGHLPPVTSRVTNITYVNIFCASCNADEEDLVTWNVEQRCYSRNDDKIDDLSDDIAQEFNAFWRLNEVNESMSLCKFHVHYEDFRILDGLELRPCITVMKVSECSPSWKDLSIREKCKSYEDPVYFHNRAYRNSHCAQCNNLNLEYSDCIPFRLRNLARMNLIDVDLIDVCQNRGLDVCIEALIQTSKGGAYPISEIVNIWSKECLRPAGKKCCQGKQYDSRTKKCKKIIH